MKFTIQEILLVLVLFGAMTLTNCGDLATEIPSELKAIDTVKVDTTKVVVDSLTKDSVVK